MSVTTKYNFKFTTGSNSETVKTTDYVNGSVASVATTKTHHNVGENTETVTTSRYVDNQYTDKTEQTIGGTPPVITILTYGSNNSIIKVEVVNDTIKMSATATYTGSWTDLDILDEGRHITFEYPKHLNAADINAEMTEIFLDKQLKQWG